MHLSAPGATQRLAVLMALVALAGCSSAGTHTVPTAPPARGAAESAMGMPGESAMGMPGESAMGMPGATFACTGLPSTGSARCTVAINVNVAPIADPHQPAALIPGFHPADLQAAYALPAQNGGGTVAIVDAYDAPAVEGDLGVYRAAFGLPPCTTANGCFTKLNQHGIAAAYPAPDPGWAEEAALDVEMVSATCPRCSIVLVEADSALLDDLGAAVDTAAALRPRAISNSYYAIEWPGESAEDVHYRHPGIAITVSSGDRGYPTYPAASPLVTAVGGTTLSRGPSGWTERPWTYTGHGCSAYGTKPSWQVVGCVSRSAVDLAAVADPSTGVSTFVAAAGGWLVAGGTSVGAPLVAAAYALSGHPAGPAYSYLHPAAFNDVPPAGYDTATGLGSPKGVGGL